MRAHELSQEIRLLLSISLHREKPSFLRWALTRAQGCLINLRIYIEVISCIFFLLLNASYVYITYIFYMWFLVNYGRKNLHSLQRMIYHNKQTIFNQFEKSTILKLENPQKYFFLQILS